MDVAGSFAVRDDSGLDGNWTLLVTPDTQEAQIKGKLSITNNEGHPAFTVSGIDKTITAGTNLQMGNKKISFNSGGSIDLIDNGKISTAELTATGTTTLNGPVVCQPGNNIFIGEGAGNGNSEGTGNVFLGFNAGFYETESNKLYITNSDTPAPLIYGDFGNGFARVNGNLFVTGEFNANSLSSSESITITAQDDIIINCGLGKEICLNNDTTMAEGTTLKANTLQADIVDFSGGALYIPEADENVIIGRGISVAGKSTLNGEIVCQERNNIFIGESAGGANYEGAGNIFIGYNAGTYETGSNKLFIANSDTSAPLLFGDFEQKVVRVNDTFLCGNIGAESTSLTLFAGLEDYIYFNSNVKARGNIELDENCLIYTPLLGAETIEVATLSVWDFETESNLPGVTQDITIAGNIFRIVSGVIVGISPA